MQLALGVAVAVAVPDGVGDDLGAKSTLPTLGSAARVHHQSSVRRLRGAVQRGYHRDEPGRADGPYLDHVGEAVTALEHDVLPLKLWLPGLRRHRGLQLKITATPVLVLLVVQTLSVLGSPFTAVPMESGTNALVSSAALFVFVRLWLALVNLVPVPRSAAPVDSTRSPTRRAG